MTKEERVELRNLSFRAMEVARYLKHSTQNRAEIAVCEAVYEAHHAIYLLLMERELKEIAKAVREEGHP